ncbi:MAG: medium chain dehydrogenase/reductase family protein [Polyangiaceae bacterium]|jgi:NADPH:quinone reductase-like Zn-dependent oxidoreductase|nr:medium chain dehydrogenase/reductase family protein [Polyangiaceae bacterium]
MKRIWITKQGPPEVLQVREEADPTPSAGEVRIRVRAAGINFADLMARVGLYPDAPKVPCVVGYEVSGVIDAVGAGVEGLKEGERVFGMPRFGGYTDTLVVSERQAFRMSDAMSFEDAAALPVVYLTAHHMMLYTGNLRPRSSVLVHSAAGGVGLAATQLAKTRDCVIFGVASKGKHDFLREQGVTHPLDSATDWAAEVRAKTKGRGVDLILDPVGGPSWAEGYDLLAPAGRLVAFGLSAASSGKTRNLLHALGQVVRIKRWNPRTLMDDNKTISGCNMGHLFGEIDMLAEQFQSLIGLYEAGKIKPHVSRTFRFDEAAAAHHFLHDRKAVGKVLLVP